MALLLGVTACSRAPDPGTVEFTNRMQQGIAFWTEAQRVAETDPAGAVSLLTSAREEYLCAALLSPGNPDAAGAITGITQQIAELTEQIRQAEQAEKDLQQKLKEAIAALQALLQRENTLAGQSQALLRKRPPPPPEENAAAAPPAQAEQQDIRQGTARVTETIGEMQAFIRELLKKAYGPGEEHPTEYDAAAEQLQAALLAQQNAGDALAAEPPDWNRAGPAMLLASRRMQDALHLLNNQSGSNNQQGNQSESDSSEQDFNEFEEMEASSDPSSLSMPMSSGQFKTALENRSLPTPNYSAEEILTEEAAHQEQRARQKAGRAGAKVEKNW